MADLLVANQNIDPSEVLLRTFADYMQEGHNVQQSYNHAKEMHPAEFQIVKERAVNHGHQNGVVGERRNSRHELLLRGHHTNTQNGVCVGRSHCATCLVVKYTTHNFVNNVAPLEILVGGSGGLIKRASEQGERIIQDQVLSVYNASLELSVASGLPVRLYAFLPTEIGQQRGVEYVYLGLWRVVSGRLLLTPLEFNCYEFRLRRFDENPVLIQQLPELGGPEVFFQDGLEEDLLLHDQEGQLHAVEDANGDLLEAQQQVQHNQVIRAMQVKVKILKQPSMLQGGVSAYQLEGLQWMLSLSAKNLNGILVDETRLDKTVQIISLIAYLMENENVTGPHLIVAPKAALSDWMTGFATWAPRIVAVCYDGCLDERKALRDVFSRKFNVLVTHHQVITTEKTLLKQNLWYYMILDEGDQLRTPTESGYKIRRTVLLTANPTMYSLQELWSLLFFVVPKIFNSVKNFEVWFNSLFAGHRETSLIRHLQHVIRPFILTRTKEVTRMKEEVEHQECDISAGQKVHHQARKRGLMTEKENLPPPTHQAANISVRRGKEVGEPLTWKIPKRKRVKMNGGGGSSSQPKLWWRSARLWVIFLSNG
ncbi:hypothetical protein POM88_026621 [Heracleum sosnowskyi]|uniref:Helicase ATP-binding domain-containing protein n=1 Tax=Heracleum sosnowskyi TaxID=360622 RepID=A0AAD8MP21_9APIA|nr:hypothetical protein POM88_026621 [Heracleum sosnowskyi]